LKEKNISKQINRLSLSNSIENEELVELSNWILNIGDDEIGVAEDGESIVEILEDILIQTSMNFIGDIVEEIYPNLLQNIFIQNFFLDRAIIAPTLEVVEKKNDYALALMPGDAKEYFSCDSFSKCDDDIGVDHSWITTEFLNEIKCSRMLNHKLIIKVGVVEEN
jgi:ATP-dependent DNA helicase PIF1